MGLPWASIRKTWSSAYTNEELVWLQDFYNKIVATQNVSTPILQEKAKDFCELQLNIKKGLRSGADVSKMMKNLLKHEEYYKYSSIFLENFNHPDGRITEFNNTNKLVKFYPGCDGGKTGFTSEAMYCLSATAKREDTRVIATVMGAQTSKDRNKEVTDLFNYAFHNFKNVKILEKDKPIPVDATIKRAKTNDIKVAPSKSVSILSKKGVAPNYELDVEINDNLKAPINKGDCIGKILVIDKQTKQTIEVVDLISLTEIEGLSYIDSIRKIIEHWTLRV